MAQSSARKMRIIRKYFSKNIQFAFFFSISVHCPDALQIILLISQFIFCWCKFVIFVGSRYLIFLVNKRTCKCTETVDMMLIDTNRRGIGWWSSVEFRWNKSEKRWENLMIMKAKKKYENQNFVVDDVFFVVWIFPYSISLLLILEQISIFLSWISSLIIQKSERLGWF